MRGPAPDPRFEFLDADFEGVRLPPRPINIFELSGFPRRETVASNVLAYFLNPRDERHGLGNLVIDSLLSQLDGAPLIGALGKVNGSTFRAAENLGSREWTVQTEHVTDDHKRIDIYLTNDALSLAIIVENKLDAEIANPFASYARRAAQRHERVLAVVLASLRMDLDAHGPDTSAWTSASITYDELFERFLPDLDEVELADARSTDLLRQFAENLSEKRTAMDAHEENEILEQFWSGLRGREAGYREFFNALGTVNTILTRRAEKLGLAIRTHLEAAELLSESFVTPGYSKSWGIREGRVAVVYVGFHLRNCATIELIVGFIPALELYGLHVKAYGHGRRSDRPFPGFDWVPVRASLVDPDEAIVAAFMQHVRTLITAHPGEVS